MLSLEKQRSLLRRIPEGEPCVFERPEETVMMKQPLITSIVFASVALACSVELPKAHVDHDDALLSTPGAHRSASGDDASRCIVDVIDRSSSIDEHDTQRFSQQRRTYFTATSHPAVWALLPIQADPELAEPAIFTFERPPDNDLLGARKVALQNRKTRTDAVAHFDVLTETPPTAHGTNIFGALLRTKTVCADATRIDAVVYTDAVHSTPNVNLERLRLRTAKGVIDMKVLERAVDGTVGTKEGALKGISVVFLLPSYPDGEGPIGPNDVGALEAFWRQVSVRAGFALVSFDNFLPTKGG